MECVWEVSLVGGQQGNVEGNEDIPDRTGAETFRHGTRRHVVLSE